MSPDQRQAISWTDAYLLLAWSLGMKFESQYHAFLLKKMILKMKCRLPHGGLGSTSMYQINVDTFDQLFNRRWIQNGSDLYLTNLLFKFHIQR